MPTPAELDALYADSWTSPTAHFGETGGTDLRLARSYARCLAAELGRRDLARLRILDFGAGDGVMSVALAELGAQTYAVEPYGSGRQFRSLDDVPGELRFDGVVAVQVIEHLADPRRVLMQLAERLEPNGWLLVTTPNAGGLRARVAGARWSEARKLGHVALYNARSLAAVLRAGGFRECRRARWTVVYTPDPVRRALHTVLQLTGLGGDLRYLAFRSTPMYSGPGRSPTRRFGAFGALEQRWSDGRSQIVQSAVILAALLCAAAFGGVVTMLAIAPEARSSTSAVGAVNATVPTATVQPLSSAAQPVVPLVRQVVPVATPTATDVPPPVDAWATAQPQLGDASKTNAQDSVGAPQGVLAAAVAMTPSAPAEDNLVEATADPPIEADTSPALEADTPPAVEADTPAAIEAETPPAVEADTPPPVHAQPAAPVQQRAVPAPVARVQPPPARRASAPAPAPARSHAPPVVTPTKAPFTPPHR